MSKRPATTRGRGRGRGRGASNGSSAAAPKRTKKNPERDCLLLLIDSGANSLSLETNEKTALDNSKNVTDWILSRKIFADSSTFLNVGYFPSDEGTARFHSNGFEKPSINMLKWIYDIQASKNDGDIVKALQAAIEFVQQAKSTSFDDKITIAIMSNFTGEVDAATKKELKDLCEMINEEGVALMFIGDNSAKKSDLPQPTQEAIEYIKSQCNCGSQLFENALNKVSFFAQKPKALRGMPFSLELSKDFKIELQLFVKISEEKLKLTFDQITDDDETVAKIREFVEVKDDIKSEVDESELEPAPEREGITKGDLIKGYHYGTSIIPFDDAAKNLAAVDKGKCLQLVQFTKKENILPQFLLSEARYFLPHAKSDTAPTALKALVQAMINLDTVAIVRYAYNAIANPRLAVLIPKISKTGCPVLQHFILPFNEDVRGFDFPELESICEEPDDFQIDAMDAYIDQLMLVEKIKTEDGKTQEVELCRPRDIRNPRNQAALMSIKRKALNMPPELSEDETKALLEMVSAPAEIIAKSQRVMNALTKSFELQHVAPAVYESAGIGGKSLAEIKGLGKIEKWEDMEI